MQVAGEASNIGSMVDGTPLIIDVNVDGSSATVRIDGELDVNTAPALSDALAGVLGGGAVSIEVDTRDLQFCDSSGIQVLIQARERALAGGGSLVLTGVSGSVEKVLSITGLLDLLT